MRRVIHNDFRAPHPPTGSLRIAGSRTHAAKLPRIWMKHRPGTARPAANPCQLHDQNDRGILKFRANSASIAGRLLLRPTQKA